MDRTDVAAQQARLAEYRKQQDHTKQPEQSTSAAKENDPKGQAFKDQDAVKPEFQKAHDHAIANGEKKEAQVSPQLRDQDLPKHASQPGMALKPPQSTGRDSDSQAHYERAAKLNDAIKDRQKQAEHENMKDGKDHD